MPSRFIIAVVLFIGCYLAFAEYQSIRSERIYSEKSARYSEHVVSSVIPALPFEGHTVLNYDEKRIIPWADARAVKLAIAAASDDSYQERFFEASYRAAHAGVKKAITENEFQRRALLKEMELYGQKDLETARLDNSRSGISHIKNRVVLSFLGYDFKRQAFRVKIKSLDDVSFFGGAYRLVPFRDIQEASLLAGPGKSSFDRVLNSRRQYEVTERFWPVPESIAKDIDTNMLKIYATAYYDITKSSGTGDSLLAHCVQIDLHDEGFRNTLNTSGCKSLNVTVRTRWSKW